MTPLARRLFAVYAILGLAIFAFPGGLVSWIDDRNGAGWLDAPLLVMRGVETVSAAVGLKPLGQRARATFRRGAGDDEG